MHLLLLNAFGIKARAVVLDLKKMLNVGLEVLSCEDLDILVSTSFSLRYQFVLSQIIKQHAGLLVDSTLPASLALDDLILVDRSGYVIN